MTSSEIGKPVAPDQPRSAPAGRFAPGQLVARRFSVVRYIARGGMGEVYEVEDRLLQDARIALKVILPEIACDAGASRRFEQEVLLARKVVHPNLCPIYDMARSEEPPPSFLFLTMKLLPGETLSERLRRPQPIPPADAISIFRQLIAGLSAIHAAGIIHRDIKPNNVMLHSTGPELCVSIMDFGLARIGDVDATIGTQSMLAGTPGYMAPEILREGPSQAADIFALGVLMHQVLTGERPRFLPLTQSVEPTAKLGHAAVPPAILHAVKEFLSIVPGRRCTAFEVQKALIVHGSASHLQAAGQAGSTWRPAWFRTAVVAASLAIATGGLLALPAVRDRVSGIILSDRDKHIAVLPLQTAPGSTPETQALGDGLMDSLAGRLSNLDAPNSTLWVVPATEVRARKVTDASGALREFGATIVVNGRFERIDDTVHLQLSLIDAKRKKQIGYVTLDAPSDDLASLQEQAILRMSRLLNLSLPADQSSSTQQSSNPAAFADYLAGVGYFARQDLPGNLDKAIASLVSATKKDPRFAVAFARLAQIYTLRYKLTSDAQWLQQAEDASRHAMNLDDKVPATYVALAQIHDLTGKRDQAIQEYQRASGLDPEDAAAMIGLAHAFQKEGRDSDAEAAYLKAISIRPQDWRGYNSLAIFLRDTGHPHESLAQLQHALTLTPDNSWVYINMALAYRDIDGPNMLDLAESALKRSNAIGPTYVAYENLAELYLQQHRFPEAVAADQQALLLNDRSHDVWMSLALAYEWLKQDAEADAARLRAIHLLEASVERNIEDGQSRAYLAALYAKLGRKAEARQAIQNALALSGRNRYVATAVADAFELMGDRQNSLKFLNQALGQGLTVDELGGDPDMQKILSDPHFSATRPGFRTPAHNSDK